VTKDTSVWIILVSVVITLWTFLGGVYLTSLNVTLLFSVLFVAGGLFYFNKVGLSYSLVFIGNIIPFLTHFFSIELLVSIVFFTILYSSKYWFIATPLIVLPSFIPIYVERVFQSRFKPFYLIGAGLLTGLFIFVISTERYVTPFELGGVGGSLLVSYIIAVIGFFSLSRSYVKAGYYIFVGLISLYGFGTWLLFPSMVYILGLELGRFMYRSKTFRSKMALASLMIMCIVFVGSLVIFILSVDESLDSIVSSKDTIQVSESFYSMYNVLIDDDSVVVTNNVSVTYPILLDPYSDNTNVTSTVLRETRRGILSMEESKTYGNLYVPVKDVQR